MAAYAATTFLESTMARKFQVVSALFLLLSVTGCLPFGRNQDFWAVRTISRPSGKFVESLSVINGQARTVSKILEARQFASSHYDGVEIELLEENDVITGHSAGYNFSQEMEAAFYWFHRLSKSKPTKILITFAELSSRREIKRRHPADKITVIDLYVPADKNQKPSGAIRNALATSLHEASHVFSNSSHSRVDEEANATLVESCFLLDSLQPSDVLHFHQTAPTDSESSTLRASQLGAIRVMAELTNIAGSPSVRGSDVPALTRLKAHCRSAALASQTGA